MNRCWDYRILRNRFGYHIDYTIHEVFYKDGKPDAHSENPIYPCGGSVGDLKEDYEMMAEAFDKPALDADTYEEVETDG